MLQLNLCVQLASLGLSLKTALPILRQMGISGLELDARRDVIPKQMGRTAIRHLLKQLEDHRLKIRCLRFQIRHSIADLEFLEARLDGLQNAMKLAAQLGANAVSCDIGQIPDQQTNAEDWIRLKDVLEKVGRFGQKEGVWLAAKTGIADPKLVNQLIKDLPAGTLMIDFDPGNLILHGHSVPEAVECLSSHVVHLHARDGVQDLSARKAIGVQLGRGIVDWPDLFAKLEQAGFSGQTILQPDHAENPVIECHQACLYLKELFQ